MIKRKILSLAWPAIGEMMMSMLMSFVDVAFVGRLGAESLAAVGLGGQLYFSLLFVFSAMAVGATALVARAVGSGEPEKVSKSAGYTLSLAILVGIAVTAVVYMVADPVVGLFHFEIGVRELASIYIKTTGSAAAFGLVLFVSNGIFRGAGLTKIPFYVAIVTNIINICGDYVLIFGKWGFPALGVRGAALATASAQIAGCAVMLFLVLSGLTVVRVHFRDLFRLGDRKLLKVIFNLSVPAGAEEVLNSFGRILGSFLLSGLGTVPFAAHQVILTAESLSYMPGYGFAVASASLVGQNLGARKPEEADEYGKTAGRLAVLFMSAVGLLFLAFPVAIINVFTQDPQVVDLGATCLRIAAFEQPFVALQMVFAGALRGAGDTRSPAVISILATWLLRIPLYYIAIYIFHWGLPAIWAITVFDWMVRSAFITTQFRRGKWKEIAL